MMNWCAVWELPSHRISGQRNSDQRTTSGFSIKGSERVTRKQFWAIPANTELRALGMKGFTEDSERSVCLWFDLGLTDFYAQWKGRLIVGWPPPERSWWRRAHRNEMPLL